MAATFIRVGRDPLGEGVQTHSSIYHVLQGKDLGEKMVLFFTPPNDCRNSRSGLR
jgi:hypothetical protein